MFFYCHELCHFQCERPKKGKENESQAYYAETTKSLLLMTYIDVTKMVGYNKELKSYFSKHDTLKVDKGTKELLLMTHVDKALNEMT